MRISIFAGGTALCNSGKSLLDREKGILVRSTVVCKKYSCKWTQLTKYVYCLLAVTCMTWSSREKTGNFEANINRLLEGGRLWPSSCHNLWQLCVCTLKLISVSLYVGINKAKYDNNHLRSKAKQNEVKYDNNHCNAFFCFDDVLATHSE